MAFRVSGNFIRNNFEIEKREVFMKVEALGVNRSFSFVKRGGQKIPVILCFMMVCFAEFRFIALCLKATGKASERTTTLEVRDSKLDGIFRPQPNV